MAENQKDLVLSPNEYAFVLDETKGNVQCNVGPHKMSLSQSDKLVKFDPKRKKFVVVERYSDAIQLFTICPEGWYIALKNPVENNRHPQPGTSNAIPENMKIGCKVNIPGPASFALYPGQMAMVIKGHTLRSNQYLVARVYDADTLNESKTEKEPDYINGQILIIKGTECPFYIPPTGIEVKAIDNDIDNGYVREAVTLERLEYCILKDEDGNKRYVHGPQVVFPEPTETFVTSPKGGYIFRAVELSKISGIYVKVIAEYTEEKDGKEIKHPVGEELFITGNDQMIYYPRPEHAIITYDGKMMHHAIAIPEGEGRYIMKRLTGEINTVRGPQMYLPDPRFEVVVKRKLSRRQCELMYPGNAEALAYNEQLSEKSVEKSLKTMSIDEFSAYSVSNSIGDTLANLEAKANISRGTSYTKPRTITLDTKYDGVVTVDVWTGYAVNVISKDGTRQVVCGPQTVLLDYDQTLEMLELSTGKPKGTGKNLPIVFLRYENNRVSDIITVQTSDFVSASVRVSYLVNFDEKATDKWFAVDNYVKHLTDWVRSVYKKAASQYTISEFCDKYQDILVDAIKSKESENLGMHYFDENGMYISDVEVLALEVQPSVQELIDKHQRKLVAQQLELKSAKTSAEAEKQLYELDRQNIALREELSRFKAEAEKQTAIKDLANRIEIQVAKDEEAKRAAEEEKAIQSIHDEIAAAARERDKLDNEQKLAVKKALADVDAEREAKTAEAMKTVLSALGPDLAAALNNANNQQIVEAIAGSIAPMAIANGESVATAVDRLLRGSAIEDIMARIANNDK